MTINLTRPNDEAVSVPDLMNGIQTQSSCLHGLLSAHYEASTGFDYASSSNPAAVKGNRQRTPVPETILTTPEGKLSGPQATNGVSDLLTRAIERHEAAYAYFGSATYLSDDSVLGREPFVDEMAIYNTAVDAEAVAMSDVCYFPARTAEDMAAKARHLRKYHTYHFGHLEDWQVENLLRSMLPEEERDQLDDGTDGDEDRVVVNVGHVLSEMLDAYRTAEERINRSSDDAAAEDVQRMTDAALEIIAYRPLTKSDERRKAEFLKEYTDGTLLTEQEQTALIASLMPEGGES